MPIQYDYGPDSKGTTAHLAVGNMIVSAQMQWSGAEYTMDLPADPDALRLAAKIIADALRETMGPVAFPRAPAPGGEYR